MTLVLKFLLWKNRNAEFQKNFIQTCIFNCNDIISCETVCVKVLLSKGWVVAVRNYSKNTGNGKKTEGKGGRVKDNEFSGIK